MSKSTLIGITLAIPVLAVLLQGGSCGTPIVSTANLTVNTSGQGTVTCNPAGYAYTPGTSVELTAVADAGWLFDHWEGDLSGNTDPATLVMDNNRQVTAVFVSPLSGCVELSQTDYSVSATIPAGCYLVNSDIHVRDGAVLTLAPGVTLRFAPDTGLFVSQTGALSAIGTAASPIVLSGQSPTRGYWHGLEFDNSNTVSNVLDYVTIEYGGGSGDYYSANLIVWGTTRVTVSHCTFQQSANYGFWFHETSTVASFENNIVTANAAGAGSVASRGVGMLTATTTYTGNDADLVAVRGGYTTVEQTWAALDVEYRIENTVTVNHHTTIAPGATLVFENNVGLTVSTEGALTAQGTTDAVILFTGVECTRGYWRGVEFDNSNSVNNLLEFLTIEYGGGSGDYYAANLIIWGTTRVSVLHCTLQQSLNYGFWFHETSTVTAFEGNIVTANAAGAGSVAPRGVGVLTASTTYAGNDADLVAVRGGYTTVEQIWAALDVEYRIENTVTVNNHTTIAPGATLVFENTTGLSVSTDGSLTAVGTATAPILLTGVETTPGYWWGVVFNNSNSVNNILTFVTIEYGGGSGDYYSANLTVWGTSRIDVEYCVLQHSLTWGIWVSHTAVFTQAGNTYAGNASGNLYIQP